MTMAFVGLFDPELADESTTRPPRRSRTSVNLSSRCRNDGVNSVRVLSNSSSSTDFLTASRLPPEPQVGNVEYKLKLVSPSQSRMEHLVTQMKWRLREGQGEAIYEIGVEDDGRIRGLSERDLSSSLQTLEQMAKRLGATTEILRKRIISNMSNDDLMVAEVLVRKVPDDQPCIELRVCVMGGADVGKSTLLGVLTQGNLDDGRGRARLNMFRHLHEIQSGRTSSVSHEILGFDSQGVAMDYELCGTAESICENSTKLITFVDLAGHQKYLRTTVSGLMGFSPHYVMLVISAGSGVVSMTSEHISLVCGMETPFFITVTKTDLVSESKLKSTLDSLSNFLKALNKVPLVIGPSMDDCVTAANNTLKDNVVPIFTLSSVSGNGLELLKRFLHLLPPGTGIKQQEKLLQDTAEFQIDELFDVPQVGTVVGGLVTQGLITEGQLLKCGPMEDGSFVSVVVNSIKRNRAPCRVIRAMQSAALAIDTPCMLFQASVCLLFHPTEICRGFRMSMHIGNVRQSVVIEDMHPIDNMRSNDKASVVFRFIRNPEYVKIGERILFREGKTKGFGRVTKTFPIKTKGPMR